MVARPIVGWLCDRLGPRLVCTILLIGGSVPVMMIGFAGGYESLLWFRLAIGLIGGSFVITQDHTSLMFAPSCVGTANATAAGWGNLGGGATQVVMPLLAGTLVWAGLDAGGSWRAAMAIAGAACVLAGIAYYRFTQDSPRGHFSQIAPRDVVAADDVRRTTLWRACADGRVWALFMIYAACFGVERTGNNVAAIYYFDRFAVDLATAGVVAGLFGLMNLFARTLGGILGDRCGLAGRACWLLVVLLLEAAFLVLFSRMATLAAAIAAIVALGLFVQRWPRAPRMPSCRSSSATHREQ